MKSIIIKEFGGIDVFQETTLPKPAIKAGHVLIKVMATSVNPLDYKMRKGFFPNLVPSFPMVLHGDVSGIIEQIGEGIKDLSVGDEVYGCVGGLLDMGGALSEYILADANLVAKKPKSLTFAEVAALPLVALTAWESLITYANIQRNQTVLIHGGTGGVGHIAIQLAKWLGANVFATSSSAPKMEITKELGVNLAINYKVTPVETYVSECTNNVGFDVVFDTVGGDNLSNCFSAAALFGKVVTILAAGQHDLTPAFLKGLTLHMVLQPLPLITGAKRDHYQFILTKIADLVDIGAIKPLIDEKKFTISQVGAAHDYLESGKAVGKVVMTAM
jgi:NADPH2:quinone reductase